MQDRLGRIAVALPLILGSTALIYMATVPLLNAVLAVDADPKLGDGLTGLAVLVWLGLFFYFPLGRWGWGEERQ